MINNKDHLTEWIVKFSKNKIKNALITIIKLGFLCDYELKYLCLILENNFLLH